MKNPYENPAVFETRTPKKQEDTMEDLRKGILREQAKGKPWKNPYFFVILAIIILIIFAITIFFLRGV